jgi:hypothetical protein
MSEGNWVPKMARLIDELLKRGAYRKTNNNNNKGPSAEDLAKQSKRKGPAMSDSESDQDYESSESDRDVRGELECVDAGSDDDAVSVSSSRFSPDSCCSHSMRLEEIDT